MTATETAPKSAPQAATPNRLANFPITFFATTMGLGGFTLALRAAAAPMGLGKIPFQVALAATVLVFVLVSLVYAAKALRQGEDLAAEWHHPVRMAFFPTISVSILLLATAFLSEARAVALVLWIIGTALQGALTLAVISGWIGTRSFQHGHLNPAWFIPAVGNVIVPVAGAQLGFPEISWLFFSAGLIFWMVLLTLVFNRLVFHDPLPGRLQPTMVIMVAPPAVAFLAWVRLTGGVDHFAHILLSLAYVFAAIIVLQLPRILRLPFALSFWALSFPLASLTISSIMYGEMAKSHTHVLIGEGLMVALVVLILALIWRTVLGIARNEICHPE